METTAKRDRQGIGHIRRLRRPWKVPLGLNRPLYLRLAGVSVSGQRNLDTIGRELLDRDPAAAGRK